MKKVKQIAKGIIKELYGSSLEEALDSEVYEHSDRVCDYALRIAEAYHLNLQEQIDIAVGALMHDIGKGFVNPMILNKPQKLTKDDRSLIEFHTQQGFLYIRNMDFNPAVVDIVHYHHERLNGAGYPERLRGRDIPLAVQIVSVADVFDALTSDRIYHDKIAPKEAVKKMKKDSGLNRLCTDILEDSFS